MKNTLFGIMVAIFAGTALQANASRRLGAPTQDGVALSELKAAAPEAPAAEPTPIVHVEALDPDMLHLARVCRNSYILEGVTPAGKTAVEAVASEAFRTNGDLLDIMRRNYPHMRSGIDFKVIPTVHCPD